MSEQSLPFKHIFGPVSSWRLGVSLGIDPIGQQVKVCNFDCIYCQVGPTIEWINERKVFVPTREIVDEIKQVNDIRIDHLTFSSNGEPTLAQNLGECIKAIRNVRKEKIAVITNSSLIDEKNVQADLALADVVVAKLDACNQEVLQSLNRSMDTIRFEKIVKGIKAFRQTFSGKLCLQLMFVDANLKFAKEMASIVSELGADQIEINTPLRKSCTQPVSKEDLDNVCKFFVGLPIINVYDVSKEKIEPLNVEETWRRHGGNNLN